MNDMHGLHIINEYDLIDITKDVSDINMYELAEIALPYIPIFLRLLRCKDFICELIIKISYTPYYQYYYIWPGNDYNFTKFRPTSSSHQQRKEVNIFRKILRYMESRNINKKYLIGRKYDLK